MALDRLDLPPSNIDLTALGKLLDAADAAPSGKARDLARSQHLLPLFEDLAALVGKIIHADLAGATEAVERDAVLLRVIENARKGQKTSQTILHASSSGAHASLSTYALHAGNTITSSDLLTDGRFNDELLRRLSVRSAMCVPLRSHQRAIGTLEFYRLEKQAFAPQDVQFVEGVSRQCRALIRHLQDEQPDQTNPRSHPRKPKGNGRRRHELRTSPRRKYPYRQLIAPIVAGRPPARESFYPVWCKDLSGGGFSIYLEAPPAFHNLVVALGVPPYVKFYRAETMHVEPVEFEGRRAFLVGCRLINRVYL
jgi:hypothetical protein